jgi:hypothetical protein
MKSLDFGLEAANIASTALAAARGTRREGGREEELYIRERESSMT